jgi:hypothetical protein
MPARASINSAVSSDGTYVFEPGTEDKACGMRGFGST